MVWTDKQNRAPDRAGAGLIQAKLAPNRLPRGSVSRPQLLDELRLDERLTSIESLCA